MAKITYNDVKNGINEALNKKRNALGVITVYVYELRLFKYDGVDGNNATIQLNFAYTADTGETLLDTVEFDFQNSMRPDILSDFVEQLASDAIYQNATQITIISNSDPFDISVLFPSFADTRFTLGMDGDTPYVTMEGSNGLFGKRNDNFITLTEVTLENPEYLEHIKELMEGFEVIDNTVTSPKP